MGRLDWIEIIFIFKMTEQELKEEKQTVVSEKCRSLFIARGFLSGKRRNNSLHKILKF